MIYAGIGARKTPGHTLHSMDQVGAHMFNAGHILRSGGAQGADRAFEIGADRARGLKRNARFGDVDAIDIPDLKEIYLPVKGWQGNNSPHYTVSWEAMEVAAHFHPRWDPLPTFVKLLMGRNSYQLLGLNLKTKADFVICWTPDGHIVGGTGQALRMAAYYEIPVINFGSLSLQQVNDRLMHILEEAE